MALNNAPRSGLSEHVVVGETAASGNSATFYPIGDVQEKVTMVARLTGTAPSLTSVDVTVKPGSGPADARPTTFTSVAALTGATILGTGNGGSGNSGDGVSAYVAEIQMYPEMRVEWTGLGGTAPVLDVWLIF